MEGDYSFVSSFDLSNLRERVNHELSLGYKLIGGSFVYDGRIYQAIMNTSITAPDRKEDDDDS